MGPSLIFNAQENLCAKNCSRGAERYNTCGYPSTCRFKKREGRLADVCHLNRTVIHNGGHTGLTCAPDVGDTYAPNTVDEPNLVSRSTNHVEPLVGDDGIRKCLPTKRNHTDVHAENIERNCNKDQHHDAHSDAKRAKQQDSDEIKDREESPVVLTGR